jgi:SAM-dependent methyltransferase
MSDANHTEMNSDANNYYKDYYAAHGENAYLGEKLKQSSRMLVFQDILRAELKPGARILDVGCGDAIFAELMPEFDWYGVDINIEKAKGRIRDGCLVETDLMQVPYLFAEKSFDAVICSEVLEHLWDLRVVHREVRRLLTRDGLYLLSTPNFDWIMNHLEHFRRVMQQDGQSWTWEHIRHYNFDSHKAFLNECGFVIEKHTGADGHYCPVVANICRAIRDGLRIEGVDVDENLLHKFAGKGIPHYSHTVVIGARKA